MPSSIKQSGRLEKLNLEDTQTALKFKDQTIAMLKEKLIQLQDENLSLKERLNERKESLSRTQRSVGSQERVLRDLNDEISKSHGLEYLVRKRQQQIDLLREEL